MTSLPTVYQQFIHSSRYARWLPEHNRRETWEETVGRYVDYMFDKQCKGKLSVEVKEECRNAILNLEVMPSMRALMTAGPALERDNIAGFNPVVGSTLMLTREQGLVPIDSLNGQNCTVLNKHGNWAQAHISSYGRQPTFRVTVRKNSNTKMVVECTGNHRWVLQNGTVKATCDLKVGKNGDKLPFASCRRPSFAGSLDYRLGIVHGLIYGDGTAQYAQERDKGYVIRLCADQDDLLPFFTVLPDVKVTYPPSFHGDPVVMLFGNFGKTHALKDLPADDETEAYIVGFIRGWLAADGAIGRNSSSTLCCDSDSAEWFVKKASRYGYVVQHTQDLPNETNFGKRKRRTVNLTIDRSSLTADDFLIARKRDRFRPLESHFVVVGVEPTGREEDVFCAEVPDTNTFVLDRGLVTGNCAAMYIDNPVAFDEMMMLLMCGCGVGFSVERQFICKLPVVPEKLKEVKKTIVVEDSKIGWATGLRELIASLYSGYIPEIDISKVRKAGERLKTFGGRASGPEPLVKTFKNIISVFKEATGRKLNSTECHDICCHIADAIVVGGVRRAAMISLSNPSDLRMRSAKSGQWWMENPQRALANNSACYTEQPEIGVFMEEWLALYQSKSGERGIINRVALRKIASRFGKRDPDYDYIVNPCCEVVLRSMGLCNLTEIIVRAGDDEATLKRKIRVATILGTMQSTLTNFNYFRPEWKQNAEEERLLGVSMTGIFDNKMLCGGYGKRELGSLLERLRDFSVEVNEEFAALIGINPAAAITTVKPSGTTSQLTDTASGIHPRYSKYYIRRVRADKKDPLAQMMKAAGVPCQDDCMKPEYNYVFSFPSESPDSTNYHASIGAVEHLELWRTYQNHWCHHKPSMTCNIGEDEWMEVGAWVWKNYDIMSGVAFLPKSGHTYEQAPYEECDKATYERLLDEFPKDIDWSLLVNFEQEDNTVSSQTLACSNGSCELVDLDKGTSSGH